MSREKLPKSWHQGDQFTFNTDYSTEAHWADDAVEEEEIELLTYGHQAKQAVNKMFQKTSKRNKGVKSMRRSEAWH